MFMSRLGNVDHVMLIADEVHTLGEKKARGIFDLILVSALVYQQRQKGILIPKAHK